ncbi:cell envelope integrity protein TolA [Frankia sp. R82]|uniref:cell envelope integrity protein TolA n=1 Tax=Frankia sp. R82 TaxID=2950553 RepID=UPI002043E180|nr:cell envelope integrity protein TolA [Frankia sp. R82]MCM3887429.1 DUF4200 domain-containing protein [Frankia sp. R82]
MDQGVVHQVILRYDREAGGFRPAASTLPPDDRVFASSQLSTLADAAYRNQDAHVGSSFCYAKASDGRGLVLHRFPDAGPHRLSAATHVLVGEVFAGIALGLASGWPHWWRGGPLPTLYPLDRRHLLEQAEEQLRQQQLLARSRSIEEELTRLVAALVDVGSAPLAVTGHTHEPTLLLIAAREILREWASSDWSFSTGEPVQHSGVRITFMLPEGHTTSDGYVDLSSYPHQSPQLINIANLVRAYVNSQDAAAWAALVRTAGIRTLDDLLSWAEGFAPEPDTEDLRRTLTDAHNQQVRALEAASQQALEALRSQVAELEKQRNDERQANTAQQNRWVEAHKKVVDEKEQKDAQLAALQLHAQKEEKEKERLAAENASLRRDIDSLQDRLTTFPPTTNVPAGQFGSGRPDPNETVRPHPGSHTGPLPRTGAVVAQPHETGSNEAGRATVPGRQGDVRALVVMCVVFVFLILLAFFGGQQ